MVKTEWGREYPYTTKTGIETKLYNIGTLAMHIGRTSQTIRKWEIGGIIPPTPFKDNRGGRLYAKEHIDAIVKIAEECKIKQGATLGLTNFSDRVYKEFEKIRKNFFEKKEG
jgi:hypothetical protein